MNTAIQAYAAIEALKGQGFSTEKATEIFWRFCLAQYLKDQGHTAEFIKGFIAKRSK